MRTVTGVALSQSDWPISLSVRQKPAANDAPRADGGKKRRQRARKEPQPQGAMATALAQALKEK